MFCCENCFKQYSSRSALSHHRRVCPKMKRTDSETIPAIGNPPTRGRPTKAEIAKRNEVAKRLNAESGKQVDFLIKEGGKRPCDSDYDVSDVSGDEGGQGRSKRVKKMKVPVFWCDTFEKGLKLLEKGASEDLIKTAIEYDKCFTKNTDKLKLSLLEYYDSLVSPLSDSKATIDADFKEMDKEHQSFLRPIVNPEGKNSKTTQELLDDKMKIEKELLYCNYGIKLREIYPSLKVISLMENVIPKEKEQGILAKVTVASSESQMIDNEFDIFKDPNEVETELKHSSSVSSATGDRAEQTELKHSSSVSSATSDKSDVSSPRKGFFF